MDKRKFGQFIKEARLSKKLTQAELAERLFIDVTAVSKWERGINYPDISMISDICKALDITEHELIESSRDTEYRQMAYNSHKYVRNKKIMFWSFTGSIILALVTCFTVNLCVGGLSWFFIVLASCALGYYAVMFFPIMGIVKKQLSDNRKRIISAFSLLMYTFGLNVLTLALLFIIYAYSTFDLGMAVKITNYGYLLMYGYSAAELLSLLRLPINRPLKLGIDSIITGIYSASLTKVLPLYLNAEEKNYFDVDFTDWAGHSDGNVSTIILAVLALLGITLIAVGIVKMSKDKRMTTPKQ